MFGGQRNAFAQRVIQRRAGRGLQRANNINDAVALLAGVYKRAFFAGIYRRVIRIAQIYAAGHADQAHFVVGCQCNQNLLGTLAQSGQPLFVAAAGAKVHNQHDVGLDGGVLDLLDFDIGQCGCAIYYFEGSSGQALHRHTGLVHRGHGADDVGVVVVVAVVYV